LLSEDEEDDDDEEEGVFSFAAAPHSRHSRPRSPSSHSPVPRLGEVSAEFLAWQTAVNHLAAAFASRLARCAAAARGERAAAAKRE